MFLFVFWIRDKVQIRKHYPINLQRKDKVALINSSYFSNKEQFTEINFNLILLETWIENDEKQIERWIFLQRLCFPPLQLE